MRPGTSDFHEELLVSAGVIKIPPQGRALHPNQTELVECDTDVTTQSPNNLEPERFNALDLKTKVHLSQPLAAARPD